jgi:uncharacterized protein (DUF952 family)
MTEIDGLTVVSSIHQWLNPKLIQVDFNFMQNVIFHITSRSQWIKAKNLATYSSDTLVSEGFTHCSTRNQVLGSANRFFQGKQNLVILVIDLDQVMPEIRYEGADAKNLFPHIYGELNIDAVIQVIDLEAGIDGLFVLPSEMNGEW